jgi:hypothetical protein
LCRGLAGEVIRGWGGDASMRTRSSETNTQGDGGKGSRDHETPAAGTL